MGLLASPVASSIEPPTARAGATAGRPRYHGIGQEQPFQRLDSFVNGLRAALRPIHESVRA